MSPARLFSDDREKVIQKLTILVQSAGESYRLTRDEYVQIRDRIWTTTAPGDPHAAQAIMAAAKGVRMARKRYMRANRVLAGFTAS